MTEVENEHEEREEQRETKEGNTQQVGNENKANENPDGKNEKEISETVTNGDQTASSDPKERQRKESTEKKKYLADLNEHLQQYYDKKVAKSVERKTNFENIAFDIVHKVIRKIHTVDERFCANNLVTLGIPYDGIQAGKPMQMEMILQLPLGENNSVYVIKDKISYYTKIQPYARDYWSDCMDHSGTFISAKLILKLLRDYLKRVVFVFSKYIMTQRYEKLPERLKRIELEPGEYNTTLILNDNIKVSILPALYVPDCRSDLTRRDIPSCSHVVATIKTTPSVMESKKSSFEEPSETDEIMESNRNFVWKYSFYVAEKNKMRTAVEGCRIKVLRVITEIRDCDQRLSLLSTDHIKSIFFQECDRIQGRRDWNDSKLAQRLLSMVRCFLATLHDGFCPSYFMQPPEFPVLNLFQDINREQMNEIANAFEELLENPISLLKLDDL